MDSLPAKLSGNVEVCLLSHSPAELGQLSACTQAFCQCLYLPPQGHTQDAGCKAEDCVGEVWRVLGMPLGQLGGSAGKASSEVGG